MYTFVSEPNSLTTHEDCGQVFNSDLQEMPHPDMFNPSNATFVDQWMEASKAFGAKYVLLVAKHCDGFVSFRTNATFADGSPYGYGVQQSSWRGGQGDLALDFVTSARTHGLKPAFYYSLDSNFYLSVSSGSNGGFQPQPPTAKGQRAATVAEYVDIVVTQVEELWGNYGPLAEIWFDGKMPFVKNASLQQQIAEVTARLQPHAVLLQGPDETNAARKGNGETCKVHDPNWYTCPNSTACRNNAGGQGDFIPAEAEGCSVGAGASRQWFWHPDHDRHAALKTASMFIDEYHNSVGLGSNLLVGLTPDRLGLVPTGDVAKLTAVGNFVKQCYGAPVATFGAASLSGPDDYIDLALPSGAGAIDRLWLREDFAAHGQRVQEFLVSVSVTAPALPGGGGGGGATFVAVSNGSSIARKRIVLLGSAVSASAVRVQVTEALAWPVHMQEVAVFAPCSYS
jgi:alpha-L-fucosidase